MWVDGTHRAISSIGAASAVSISSEAVTKGLLDYGSVMGFEGEVSFVLSAGR